MTFLRTGKTGRVLLAFGSIALVTAGVLPLYFRSNRNLVPATAAPDPIPVIGPDVGAPMIDLIDDRTMLIVGCTALVVAGLIGVLRAVIRARREEASFSCSITHASVTALTGWLPVAGDLAHGYQLPPPCKVQNYSTCVTGGKAPSCCIREKRFATPQCSVI